MKRPNLKDKIISIIRFSETKIIKINKCVLYDSEYDFVAENIIKLFNESFSEIEMENLGVKGLKCKDDFYCKIEYCELKECSKFEMK